MSSVFRETSSSLKDNLDYGSVFHDMDLWTTVIEKTTAIAERLLDKHADVFGFLERREGRVSAGNEASEVVLRAIARAANTWVGKHLWRELVAAELLRKHDYDADVVFRLYGKLVYSTTGKAFSSGDVPIDVYEFLKDNDPPTGTSPSMEVFRMMRPENVHSTERVLGYLYSHLLYEKTNPALVRVWFWLRGDKRSLQDFVRYASLVTTDWTRVLPEALRYYRNEGTQWVNFTMRVYAALCILRDNACHIETLITKTPMSHRVRVVIVEATRLSPLEAIMRHDGGASSVYEVEEYETAARRSQTRCDDDRDWLRDLHYMLNVEKQYAKSTFYEKVVRTVPMAQRLWDYLLNSSDYEATVRNFNRFVAVHGHFDFRSLIIKLKTLHDGWREDIGVGWLLRVKNKLESLRTNPYVYADPEERKFLHFVLSHPHSIEELFKRVDRPLLVWTRLEKKLGPYFV